ncbi:MAG TPA: trehalose-6-phosphate synthase [Burkholderiales bacterium]|nr:trehalose-6-phosphate synthase [Burkholderiales bacterium]
MRLSLRFLLPLAIALGAIAYSVVPLVDQLTLKWFVRDLEMRTTLVASAAQEPLVELLTDNTRDKVRLQRVQTFFNRMLQDERLYAIGFCNAAGALVYHTAAYAPEIGCGASRAESEDAGHVVEHPTGPLYVATSPVTVDGTRLGEMVIVHDMSFIERRSEDTKQYIVWLFAAIGAVIALITVIIAELSWRGWVAGIKALIRGQARALSLKPRSPELTPIARDLEAMVQELERERRMRDEAQISWAPKSLRNILHQDLKGNEILIVSNREPYMHVRRGGRIDVLRPASGLVTALEPVMRACSGTWIAHGSGNADRETVDENDHVMVPPEKPAYRIRRVWLTREEEAGYYYGFSNEGLWPLCHVAHARPVFRTSDWEHYRTVNRRFAEAIERESRTEDPIILVQDYHFALLPRLIRERLPRATIITFWHIPWPNPEAFGICPWRDEILDGLLGSSILGFHTQYHCNNFMDTVDRFIEARVNRETFTISYGGEPTEVHRYPISIEWPPSALAFQKSVEECRERIRSEHALSADVRIGIGVDRLDYTKGILERLAAVERLLELHPNWIGRFAFIQIAAPSRSSIEEYQALDARVRAAALRINNRFATPHCKPVILKIEHHDPVEVYAHYRAADVCFVSSLHDGMNLVAKEYVASRDDERGVLILSEFTGAAGELPEAIIVNPYDTEQCATALRMALEMPPDEQRERIRSMRTLIQEFNVYRWAGRMLLDAARMRHRRRISKRGRAPAKIVDLRRA